VRATTARYGARVTVAVQPEAHGMGDALLAAASALSEEQRRRPWLVTQAHDVVDPEVYRRVLAEAAGANAPDGGAIVGQEVGTYFPGGYLALHGERVMAVVEKPPPGSEPSRFVNLVIHLHRQPEHLLEAVRATYASDNQRDDHYERALTVLCGELTYRLVPYSGPWQPIKYPWHVLGAMQVFLERLPEPAGPLPEGVSGNVLLEEGVRVLPGAHVVGPAYIGAGTLIGTGALVRGAMIGRGCEIGFGCEVARSYLGDRCVLHHNYVGDSVLEGEVGLGFGTVTGNWPFYPPPVNTTIDGQRTSTGMEKLGSIIGARVRTGIGVLLNPGIKIGRRTYIGPGVVVTKDVREGQLLLVRQELIERENPFGE
jgi:bifunctional UDP-N-acetylglucosamine pyrophosphorylase/glucosamine-1-phosphate N-acetyltransferase